MATETRQEEREQAEGRFDDEGGRQRSGEGVEGTARREHDHLHGVADEALKNLTVLSADGQALGSVVSLQIDVTEWRVSALEVRLDRQILQALGVRRHLLRAATLAIPTELIHSVRDAIILSVSTSELRHRASDAEAAAPHS